jgi:ribosomal protein S25
MILAEDNATASLLEARREIVEEYERRLAAIDDAIRALGGDPMAGIPARRHAVGDDKLDAVRRYVKRMKRVRQSDIVRETGFNSGTVSSALHALQIAGEVTPGPKEDRSRVWEVAKASK